MELHLPEILRHLSSRPMALVTEHGLHLVAATNHARRDILSQFRPMLHRAGKFIFDSGHDIDEDTTTAIKQTAIALMEDGQFHLPYPITWIEDPFDENPVFRNYYLARERGSEIRVWLIVRHPPVNFAPMSQHFTLCTLPIIINLCGKFEHHVIPVYRPPGTLGHNPQAFQHVRRLLAELDYSIRKFVVTLTAGGVERTEVSDGPHALTDGEQRAAKYPYTIIRIPLAPLSTSETAVIGKRRRRHFVRGFVWGKNTRPREEQRWVPGYYRGDATLGDVERTHYEVRG